ncbi:Chaperone J-domain superfamily [Arabidopsis suecica]|uniref:Chaperone J-domain superfamily n=1 Tax=Arabidopsis suecica TaxID=45249 RepID=A0A8T2CDP1_ARASU|nr:Chaperone J-domain superfamily [Arabidopsis suecica]
MNDSMKAPKFFKNQLKLAEAHYRRGNLKGAIEMVNDLTFGHPNTSSNHHEISQILLAYQINLTSQKASFTHYDILRISNPFCSHQMIQRKYRDILVKLYPDTNKSIAAKSAFEIINYAWKILSDPEKRKDYNIKKGLSGDDSCLQKIMNHIKQ